MAVELRMFVQESIRDSAELESVAGVVTSLHKDLNRQEMQTAIAVANAPGASSAGVQAVFATEAAALGFRNEAKGLFAAYENKAVRPDYYLPLPEHATGILLEVERGKTTINNMDFLDFWKCHLCEHANHLVLLVPQELRQHEGMSPRREYNAVVKRLSSFFEPRNYTNVRSLWVLGY